MLGDIVAVSMVRVFPVTGKCFSENRVQRFLDAPTNMLASHL